MVADKLRTTLQGTTVQQKCDKQWHKLIKIKTF
jgi:hypothetical protein